MTKGNKQNILAIVGFIPTIILMWNIDSIYSFITGEPMKAPVEFYHNIDLKIVSFNSDCSLTSDKFHTPQLCNSILFETLSEPKLYTEINTCKISSQIHIDTKWLYNHKVGDTIHFDYLKKERFFTINNRKNEKNEIKK